jgi:hypothetical protein
MMLAKVKLAMRISTAVFDSELLDLIASGIADIKHAGAQFEVETTEEDGVATDYTVTDPLASTAIVTYVRMMFGSPDDFDRLKASYEMQKGQMREARAYGMEAVE